MAQIKINAFLILERSFTKRLQKSWRKTSVNLFTRINKAINAEDWTKVDQIIDSIDFGITLKSNQRFMEFIGRGAFLFGVGRHGDIKKSKFIKEKKPIPFIKEASQNLQAVIAEQGTLFIKGNIRKVTRIIKTRTNESKVTKAAKVRSNADLLKNAIDGKTNNYLETVSSLHNSRLAGWGYVKEAQALGYTTYSVSEQIDSDTICPICISMHGKTFKVKQVAQRLESLLTVDNLNDLKHMAPWPRQNKASVQKFRSLTNNELVSNGFQHPPYHPNCRGLLVRSDDTAALAPIPAKNLARVPLPARLPIAAPIDVIPGTLRSRFLPIKSSKTTKAMAKDYKKFKEVLTSDQVKAFQYYKNRDFALLNRVLRGETKPSVAQAVGVDKAIAGLESAFLLEEAKLKRDVIVFRGIQSEELLQKIQKGNLEGSIIADKGYLSTTFSESIITDFIPKTGGIVMEIRISKEIQQAAVPIDAADIAQLGKGIVEQELILPPNMKFQVIKVEKPNKIVVEVIR